MTMTLEQAKQYLANYTSPTEMTTVELEIYRQALHIVSTNWAEK